MNNSFIELFPKVLISEHSDVPYLATLAWKEKDQLQVTPLFTQKETLVNKTSFFASKVFLIFVRSFLEFKTSCIEIELKQKPNFLNVLNNLL